MPKLRPLLLALSAALPAAAGLITSAPARAEVPDVTWQDRLVQERQVAATNAYGPGWGRGPGGPPFGHPAYGPRHGYGPPVGYGYDRPFRARPVAGYPHHGYAHGPRCFVEVTRSFDGYGWVKERRRICR